jgi:hypothetical protein
MSITDYQFFWQKFKSMHNKIRNWLEDSADINLPENGYYIIDAIIGCNDPILLKDAIKKGININQDLGKGCTPLHQAFDNAIDGMIQDNKQLPYSEIIEIIKILIKNGADLTKKDFNGKTPLDSLNTYAANITTFNHLKDIFRPFIPNIDEIIEFKKNAI